MRILTDDELRLLEVENNWDISGTDWVYPRLTFDGAYTFGFKSLQVTTNPAHPHWYYWRFDDETGPVQESNRFYALGTQIYLDDQNTDFPPATFGEADIANQRLNWAPGGNSAAGVMWNKTLAYSTSSAPFTITAVDDQRIDPLAPLRYRVLHHAPGRP